MASPVPVAQVSAHATTKWLKGAFVFQSILFALLIAALIFVSVSYSVKQRNMLAEIAQQKADLAKIQSQIDQKTKDLATSEMNYAMEMMNAKRYSDAALHIDDSLREWPGEPVAWREKALIFLGANRGQEALDDFDNPKSGVDRSDPRNLITEAILYCGIKQPGRADQIVAALPASFAPEWNDKKDFKVVCGRDIGK